MNFTIPPSVISFLQGMVGKRISLVSCSDPYTRLTHGDEGVVTFVDDLGTVHVKWDNGSNLGLVYGEDNFVVL